MADRDLYVLGINAYDHDVAACLLRNGEPVVAIAKERLTRVKHDLGFYGEAVDYCLDAAGIPLSRVDLVVRNTYTLAVSELERRLLSHDQQFLLPARERKRAFAHPLYLGDGERVRTCSHHLAHAYSAFAVSPFEEGAVMIVDGIGSHREDVTEEVPAGDDAHPLAREAESYYRFEGSRVETVRKVFMGPVKGVVGDDFQRMPGIGGVYSRVSSYIFGHWNRCGEVMGLAPYGPDRVPRLLEIVDDELRIHSWPAELRSPFLGDSDANWEASVHRTERENLARRVQADTEEALLTRARRLHETTGAKNLVLAGGVALNCVANGRILEETSFEHVWVQPAAGDDGIALGCALYGHIALAGRERSFVMESPALGRHYGRDEVDRATRGALLRIATRRTETSDTVQEASRLLARGRILGWFSGRSEFGPRALGHRSILADPRDAKMKDRLNERVKHRQGFRPFAPAVPAERAAEFFEEEGESPFMTFVKRVRPEKRDVLPAIAHVDGTARVQTVRREAYPAFHALLTAFGARTGVPVLLNTSFNIRGEPIVETPEDAVRCFLGTDLDALVFPDRILEKRDSLRRFSPALHFASRVRSNLTSATLRARLARSLTD